MADSIDFTGHGIASTFAAGTPKIVVKVAMTGIASTLAFGTPRVPTLSNLYGGTAGTSVADTAAKKTSSAPASAANSESTVSVG